MKKTLKESVRDINRMIVRIDHPVISEGPGDEGEIGRDSVEKGMDTIASPEFYKNLEKQTISMINKYAPTNPTALMIQKKLNSQGIKGGNFKSGDVVSLLQKNKVPFSLQTTTGKDLKAKLNIGGKNVVFGVQGGLKTDYGKVKDLTLQANAKIKIPVHKKGKGIKL